MKGDAWTIMPNADKDFARAGDVLLFNYGGYGEDHAALIVGFVENEKGLQAIIQEANFKRCKAGNRIVAMNDPTVKGIYRPVIHNPVM